MTARGAHVAEPLVDRQLLLAADAQRLVELAARLQDVGDLAHGDGARAHVAEPLENTGCLVQKRFRLADVACLDQTGGLVEQKHGPETRIRLLHAEATDEQKIKHCCVSDTFRCGHAGPDQAEIGLGAHPIEQFHRPLDHLQGRSGLIADMEQKARARPSRFVEDRRSGARGQGKFGDLPAANIGR